MREEYEYVKVRAGWTDDTLVASFIDSLGPIGNYGSYNTLLLKHSSLSDCSAKIEGGAIHAKGLSKIDAEGSSISACTATDRGGAVYAERTSAEVFLLPNTPVTMTDTSIVANQALIGAGMYLIDTTTVLERCLLQRNVARSDSGGIYQYGGYFSVVGSGFEANAALSFQHLDHFLGGSEQAIQENKDYYAANPAALVRYVEGWGGTSDLRYAGEPSFQHTSRSNDAANADWGPYMTERTLFFEDHDETHSLMQDNTFIASQGIRSIVYDTPIAWTCQLGFYMPLTGDVSAAANLTASDPCSYPCAAGYYGDRVDYRNASCSGSCPIGHYCVAGTANPTPCPAGHSMPAIGAASIDSCIPCAPGSFSASAGSTECEQCRPGTYTSVPAQTECISCPAGGFCEEAGAATAMVWQACPAGTHSSKVGASSPSTCLECSAGTASAAVGANSSNTCTPCRAGTFAASPGSETCESCDIGTYSPVNATKCTACQPGTYAKERGLGQCIPCPYPLSSPSGSSVCPTCLAGFEHVDDGFFLERTADAEEIMARPDVYCKQCPTHADCSATNTTLANLGVPPGYWRASPLASVLYKCDDSKGCVGSCVKVAGRVLAESDPLCAAGYYGPRCEGCSDDDDYYDEYDGRCKSCPNVGVRAGIAAGVIVGVLLLLVVLYVALQRSTSPFARRLLRMSAVTSVSAQTKFKIFISFYQVAGALEDVYGVRLHESLTDWMDVISHLRVDVFELTVPAECTGTMRERLIVGALWPYAVVVIIFLFLGIVALVNDQLSRPASERVGCKRMLSVLGGKCLFAIIFVFYCALPSVSRNIFKARQCESFVYDSFTGEQRSYLVADFSINCNSGSDWSNQASSLDGIFWAFFVLWPVMIPLLFLAMIVWVRRRVSKQRVTLFGRATGFLWRDYEVEFMYWEAIDLWRKLFLVSFILFVDTANGSSRVMRLVIATIVSSLYLTILSIARPYKRKLDDSLSQFACLLLTCCFALGIPLKLCEEGQWGNQTCLAFTGITSSLRASVLVIVITLLMLAITLIIASLSVLQAITEPTIRLAGNGREPKCELSRTCHFHGFISHIWSTGQDQTHTIVAKMQLLLPEATIWLDVTHLQDISKLEESVADSTVVIMFLSRGYFRSGNCRREVYATLNQGKPVVPVHEIDEGKGGASIEALKAECREHCVTRTEDVVQMAFGPTPIPWIRGKDYQLVSLKMIASGLLAHSPYYKNNPASLSRGLTVPGELGGFRFATSMVVLVCSENDGAEALAGELTAETSQYSSKGSSDMLVHDAGEVLAGALPKRSAMLVYLNTDTFRSTALVSLLKRAIENDIHVVMAHETDPAFGGCAFGAFFEACPKELQMAPYSLFNRLAIPLFSTPEHRRVSLRHLLRDLGGVEVNQTIVSRCREGLSQIKIGVDKGVKLGRSLSIKQNSSRRFLSRRDSETGEAAPIESTGDAVEAGPLTPGPPPSFAMTVTGERVSILVPAETGE